MLTRYVEYVCERMKERKKERKKNRKNQDGCQKRGRVRASERSRDAVAESDIAVRGPINIYVIVRMRCFSGD